jgi:hypothetical protein
MERDMRVEIKFKYTEHMRVSVECNSEKEARELFHKYVKKDGVIDGIYEREPFHCTEREDVTGVRIKEAYQWGYEPLDDEALAKAEDYNYYDSVATEKLEGWGGEEE